MTNPNDPWGQRPEDSPTERLGSPGTESTKPYGGGGFDEWGQPSNPTRALPPHDAQWGAYESGYPVQPPPPQQPPPGYGHGYPGAPPPGYPPRPQDGDQGEPPKRHTGLWIMLGLAVLALIAVAGVLGGLVLGLGDSGDDNTAAPPPSSVLLPPPVTQQPSPNVPPDTSGLPGLPGLGGDEDLGATMGSITANTGTEITMSTLGGSTVRVLIDDATQVISLTSTKAAELPVGDMVMVQGDKNPDGSIHAKIIISTALPGGPR
ncbi:DUF5666 domain-containing protein [Nocardia mangyaensis]|uniref:DUF5666 domain-containing protein n=1 Tax=Nocardia mangyaensis TaxID=2213200 RepID=UPI00267486B6|nr:DUF5666 domain-containing protein [Nocardia mangyaensis]MDO3651032.1 DUF5666 domain-containing protein [Nocardia mangyaensis]